jgi:hypothetical protein
MRARIFSWPIWWTLAAAFAAPVWAHHSAVAYDETKTILTHAVLKEFRWGAPHSVAVFSSQDQDGKWQDFTIETAAPVVFFKQGFNPRDLKKGDSMDVTWHPAKLGSGGLLVSLKLADGRTFKETGLFGAPPAGNTNPPGPQGAKQP